MIKALELITDSLEDILQLADEEPIESSTMNTSIRYLNDMMFMWDALGISLGYTRVENAGSDITVADGALMGIKAYLAISLAPKFKATITPELAKRATDGYRAILSLAVSSGEMSYPSTLPMGSGNHRYGGSTFYPEEQNLILSETNGNIGLEDSTEES